MPSAVTSLDSASDENLISAIRTGDSSAYAELWRRHHSSALRVARGMTSSHDPEDLVQESFTRILNTLNNGKGPTENFRAYLYATMRSVSIAWSGKLEPTIDISTHESALVSDSDIASLTEDRRMTAQAFKSLPQDWRTVLWYSEVEGMTPAEIAPLMGINARAVSALAFRAREGLRENWLSAHISNSSLPETDECKWMEENLGAYTRGNLSSKRTERAQEHLSQCVPCSILLAELNSVSASLRSVLLPLILGISPTALSAILPLASAGSVALALNGSATTVSGTSSTATPISGVFSKVRDWAAQNPLVASSVGLAAIVAAGFIVAFSGVFATEESPLRELPSADAPSSATARPIAPTPLDSSSPPATTATTEPLSVQNTDPVIASEVAGNSVSAAPTQSGATEMPNSGDPNRTSDEATPTQQPSAPSATQPTPPADPQQPAPTPSPSVPTEPIPTPTPEPSPEPSPEPTPEPSEPSDLLVSVESDPKQVDLMPRFSGSAPIGTSVQLFDAKNLDFAVSERIQVTALSGTSSSADIGHADLVDAAGLGAWQLDVASWAPTGTALKYVAKFFEDDEHIGTTQIQGSYNIEALPIEGYSFTDVREVSGKTIANGGTLVTDSALDQVAVRFTMTSTRKNVENPGSPILFNYVLNGVPRVVLTLGSDQDTRTWTTDSASVPKRLKGNTIAVREARFIEGSGYRYGPERVFFTFDIEPKK